MTIYIGVRLAPNMICNGEGSTVAEAVQDAEGSVNAYLRSIDDDERELLCVSDFYSLVVHYAGGDLYDVIVTDDRPALVLWSMNVPDDTPAVELKPQHPILVAAVVKAAIAAKDVNMADFSSLLLEEGVITASHRFNDWKVWDDCLDIWVTNVDEDCDDRELMMRCWPDGRIQLGELEPGAND